MVVEPDEQTGQKIIKAKLATPLPIIINAEAGAIINMIRSSLDILAVALAERNGHKNPNDVYFPIADGPNDFIGPKGQAFKKVKKLSQADRSAIESLKPYKGGDNVLYSLHQLDIKRKHRRLVNVDDHARSINYTQWGTHPSPEFIYNGILSDGSPLLRVPSDSETGHVNLSLEVTFSEGTFSKRRPVVQTLYAFAARAEEIINIFG